MNTILNTKKVLAGVVLASSAFFAANASAVVVAWDWTTDGGFVNTAAGAGAATCSNGPTQAACNLQFDNVSGETPSGVANTSSIMSWGTGFDQPNQSGLQAIFGTSTTSGLNAQLLGSSDVFIPDFQQIITNGGWTNTGAAVHYNNPIFVSGGNMATSTLTTTFQLTSPFVGPIAGTSLSIDFNETLNAAACPGPNPHGTICDDIFSLSGSLAPIVFPYLGQFYQLSFQFADGPGAIVIGNTIYTKEDSPGTAVVYVQARIDTITIPVPVPGVLALMGMGLVMLGLQVRGRRRKLV